MTGKIKFLIIPALTVLLFLLAGFDLFGDVELSYKKPLIDLYGNSSDENPFNDFTETVNSDGNRADTESEEENRAEPESRETKDRHIIGIKYKTISLDGKEVDIESLADYISSKAGRDSEIMLWDNYAEYHTYLSVKEMLEGLKADKGFKLTERALEVLP